ncbi:hypothetical protein [Alistipes indistinctus]|jgi:hypothetical protein|uniref:hypothetical protein n=1 Tax=Alistipes indistinctus TaxID=626932 RepID=UPI003AEFEE51
MLNLGFNSRFTIKQTKMLSELFNNFGVFQPAVNPTTLAALFSGKLKKPLVVRNARLLCYIMDCLSQALLITNIWQSVAERTECFVSVKGRPITRNTLSSAKYCAVKFDTIPEKATIRQYIDILKGLK